MSVELSTKPSSMILIEQKEVLEKKEKLIKTDNKGKKKFSKKTSYDLVDRLSYQRNPEFIKFIFEQAILPLVEALRELKIVKKNLSSKDFKQIREKTADSLFYKLLKASAEKSIALRMETLQLAILRINMMSPGEDGTALHSPETYLASLVVEYCVKELIKSKGGDKNTEKIWSSEQGKQFFVDLSLLNEQHFNCEFSTPMDILIYKLETAANLDPEVQKFITSTTNDLYKPIKDILYTNKRNINEDTENTVVQEAVKYFSVSLKNAYLIFKSLDMSSKEVSNEMKSVYLFRKNTIATVRVMKKTQRMKHLNFLAQMPEDHEVLKKNIIIEKVEHTLTIARNIKTNTAKVITLAKQGSEDVDVYLFVQIVENPHESPNSQKEALLLKFEVVAGTNLISLQEADEMVKKAIINEFKNNKYTRSLYTAIKYEKEIVLVEIFKQLGISLNSRTRAGTLQAFEQKIRAKDDFKKTFHDMLESFLGAPIDQYLAKCYHNKDLNTDVYASSTQQKHLGRLAKLSIEHIENAAKDSVEEDEYPFKWVFQSILASGYDDPSNPVDIGDTVRPFKKVEKIELNLLEKFFQTALSQKEKVSDEVLLGLADVFSESISDAFSAGCGNTLVKKMVKDNLRQKKLGDIKNVNFATKVDRIFKAALKSWKLTCNEHQMDLFSTFFNK